jgi:hypothetical protein
MRTFLRFGLMTALVLTAAPASAQVIHSVSFGGGFFFPRGYDVRDENDAIFRNLTGDVFDTSFVPPLTTALAFPEKEGCFDAFNIDSNPSTCMKAFRGGNLFGEWNVAFGDRIEVGAGVGFYSKTVSSLYRDLQNETGADISQEIKLRMVPISATVRFMPFNRVGEFQPYVGFSLNAINWRYSEVGDFVDTIDYPETGFILIFPDRFVASGTSLAPGLVYGARIPMGGDIYALTLEGRYHWGTGNTGGLDAGFLGDKIDLGGGTFNVGFLVRF